VSRHTHGFANNFAPLLTQVEPIDILDLDSGRVTAIRKLKQGAVR
jgi:hypothetical protein